MGGGSAQINALHKVSPSDGIRAALANANSIEEEKGADNNRLLRLCSSRSGGRLFSRRMRRRGGGA